MMIDETHALELTSWVPGAEVATGDFPIQNLPYGAFVSADNDTPRLGVAIGHYVLDLHAMSQRGLLDGVADEVLEACRQPTLNALMGLGREHWRALRLSLSRILRAGSQSQSQTQPHLFRQDDLTMVMPVSVGDYTDFYSSIHHAVNAGRLFRPDNPLLPNYKHVPVAYHGRASSVVVSGKGFRRPWGQQRTMGDAEPIFAPSSKLDFEMELGFYVGRSNALGEPVPISQSEDYVFGMCLLNDWSARDIQAWEYQPLGPFLGKSFLTSVSPWVVTMDALAPFRQPMPQFEDRPDLLAYLSDPKLEQSSALDIRVEVALETAAMRANDAPAELLARAPFAQQYWSVFQMLTHHASNGCNLRPGDLLGTGTISGTESGEEGCLLEKTANGARPVKLPNGEVRQFLEDGDEVILRATCVRDGFVSIGFGECRGRVEPAIQA